MNHSDYKITLRLQGLDQSVDKIPAIKWFRELLGLGLKDAKELVEALPHYEPSRDASLSQMPSLVRTYRHQFVHLVISPSIFCYYHFRGMDNAANHPGRCYQVLEVDYAMKDTIPTITVE